ncbi:EF-P lysine aminoacylase GenX [Halovibrio salipaludis]|uniref:EF-P lysine aminoacylase GenX n=1 Tax=Halovibrio salipaludis TaxID=2032626 RepID=A0A2A2EX66_9GAMM|nr:EF-P lysine aminoacylase EpmA [Halovibrio salipaludis]PAU76985.1 EF-P lysine aminoacylase GenX [Halovibrio salipaludis]
MSWKPGATPAMLRARAQLLRALRDFFDARGVLEVQTPVLGRHTVTEPAIESLPVTIDGLQAWLQTSPEYFMKRLLAAGSGSIYQIGPVFRAAEQGRRHNPEFTLLEWYRVGFDLEALMVEVADLVQEVMESPRPHVAEYRELMQAHAGVDPWRDDPAQLAERASAVSGIPREQLNRGEALDLLMSGCVEPALADQGPVIVQHYPPDQCALAAVSEVGGVAVARRFELYLDGIEIGNAYEELLDATEQCRRFEADNARRREAGQPIPEPDGRLLEALEAGLPQCSGMAIGVDRLLMHRTGAASLDEVMAFSLERL